MANITDATFTIYGIVSYDDNTWAPISTVFGYKDVFTLIGSDDALCEISSQIPELLTDIDNGFTFSCNHIHKTVTDYSLSASGVVTYDDQTTRPYLAQYTPGKHVIIFPMDPIQSAIASSPVSDELLEVTESVSVGPPSGPTTPPDAPTNLSAFASNALVALTWIASVGATSYNVKRAVVTGGPYTTVGTSSIANFNDSTVTNGTRYFYVVSAVNTAGESGNSNEANALPNLADNAMATVPFSVPFTTTVNVSGGGSALQSAVTAAAAGTRLLIQDSMAYSPLNITSKTDLTIAVVSGQLPTITAVAGAAQSCIKIGASNSGLKISGLKLIGTGNGASGSVYADGLINGSDLFGMASIDRVIIEDCIFEEGAGTVTSGASAVALYGTDGSIHQNVWIHRCVATNCGSNSLTTGNGIGTFEVSGFTNVYIQNSKVTRTATLARTSSNMRGFTWKSIGVIVENCLADDIGTAGSNEGFKHHGEAAYGTAVGSSTVRNCVANNVKRGFSCSLAGVTMIITQSVCRDGTAGIAQTFVRQSAGTTVYRNSIIVGAGDGTAFDAAVTEDHNDVFTVAANGKTLDVTDFTIDPVFHNISNFNFTADAASLQTGALDGGLIGVRYTATGEAIIWATP